MMKLASFWPSRQLVFPFRRFDRIIKSLFRKTPYSSLSQMTRRFDRCSFIKHANMKSRIAAKYIQPSSLSARRGISCLTGYGEINFFWLTVIQSSLRTRARRKRQSIICASTESYMLIYSKIYLIPASVFNEGFPTRQRRVVVQICSAFLTN